MTIGDQFRKLKDNWLIILAVLVVMFYFSGFGVTSLFRTTTAITDSFGIEESVFRGAGVSSVGFIAPSAGFAPEVEERSIVKTASLSSNIERGDFLSAEASLKSIVKSSSSFILNENVRRIGEKKRAYFQGSYQIKVEDSKYDSVILQLRDIGEVTSFNENAQDVTGRVTDLQSDLDAERARLARYQQLFSQATTINEKLQLDDRIFNQERRITFLEESLQNINQRVTFSTISVTLTEEQSEFVNIVFVKFSQLVQKLVNSINSVLLLILAAIPYAIAIGIIVIIVKWFKRRN